MPMLSYVHQLFSAEQCQAYIHALRWKDRPLHCPRCHSHEVDPWGNYHYRPGVSVQSVQKVPISLLCEINSLTGHIIYFSNNISDFL
jgi:Transposase zinc-ribbon domain